MFCWGRMYDPSVFAFGKVSAILQFLHSLVLGFLRVTLHQNILWWWMVVVAMDGGGQGVQASHAHAWFCLNFRP